MDLCYKTFQRANTLLNKSHGQNNIARLNATRTAVMSGTPLEVIIEITKSTEYTNVHSTVLYGCTLY